VYIWRKKPGGYKRNLFKVLSCLRSHAGRQIELPGRGASCKYTAHSQISGWIAGLVCRGSLSAAQFIISRKAKLHPKQAELDNFILLPKRNINIIASTHPTNAPPTKTGVVATK